MRRTPRLPLAIVRLALPPSAREWIIGDLLEELERVAAARGEAAARRWMWGEALRTIAGAARLRMAVGPEAHAGKGDSAMQTLLHDVRYATRLLLRSPGFTLTALATLAIGIGANATIFSVVHGVVLEPLPYAGPERLVRVFDSSDRQPKFPMAPGNFRDYREQVEAFEGLAAYEKADLQIAGDRPEQLRGMRVTSGFFTLLGWAPALGRDFTLDDELPDRGDAAILSHALWQRRFGGDPSVVGRTVRFSDRPFVVAGVLPPGFQHVGGTYRSYGHGETVDVWWVRTIRPVPLPQDRNQHFLNVVGRLREGVSLAQAGSQLDAAAERLAATLPNRNGGWSARVTALRDEIVGGAEPTLMVLLAAVQLVLLLACVNVAGLLLGRATLRGREIGVRSALGASRVRLVRQLVVESLVLAAAGGALGIGLSAMAIRMLPLVGAGDTPRLPAVDIDWMVVAYTAGATLLTAVLFGLAPALQLARSSVSDTLKHGGRGSAGASHNRLRGLLVSGEIALALVLVVGAGLLLRSFVKLSAVDQGFRAEGVLTARFSLPPARYPDNVAGAAFYARVRERARSLPGVLAAGFATDLPWTGYDENTSFGIIGRSFPEREGPEARFHMATPGYFRALTIPLVAGRDIAESDVPGAPLVVVVNESLARRHWKDGHDAIGARLDLWGEERTIVGVVGDVRDTPWASGSEPALYFPQAQQSFGDMMLVLKSDRPPAALVEPVTRLVAAIDPALPVAGLAPLETVAGRAFSARRFLLTLIGAFGVTALFLAVVGVYGVMAQAVSHRVREFGVRQALGATRRDILRLVMKSGAAIGAAGAAAGIALAFGSTRLLASALYGIQPTDPLTFGAAALLLVAATLGASYLPARRAMNVDPAVALRGE